MQQYPNCTFVTFHDAYPLAKRYQLKQVAVWKFQKINSPLDAKVAANNTK